MLEADDALASREAGLAVLAQAAKRKVEGDDEPLIICIASATLAVAAVVLGGEEDNHSPPRNGPAIQEEEGPRRLFDHIWGAWLLGQHPEVTC